MKRGGNVRWPRSGEERKRGRRTRENNSSPFALAQTSLRVGEGGRVRGPSSGRVEAPWTGPRLPRVFDDTLGRT